MPDVVNRIQPETLNPFISSVDEVFNTMLTIEPRRTGLALSRGARRGSGLSGIIGISGAVSGVVVLTFPTETAIAFAGRMIGAELTSVDDQVIDAVSELSNMIAGAAKAKLASDPPAELSLPSVVHGKNYSLRYPSKAIWVEVPFATDAGEFNLELTFTVED